MIINATIHNLTESQVQDGAVEPSEEVKNGIKETLIINNIPTRLELEKIGVTFAKLCFSLLQQYKGTEKISFLIGSGTPSVQSYIVKHMDRLGVNYVYSHSNRECVETHNPDGTVSKNFIFEHKGWY